MSTLPKTEDRVGSSMLATRAALPSHLVLVPKSMATKDTSDHRHYRGGHSRRQYAVRVGYLSPRLISKIPEGIPNTQNTQRSCKWRRTTFTYSLMLSHIQLCFDWSSLGSMSAEGFLSLMTLVLVYDLGQFPHTA